MTRLLNVRDASSYLKLHKNTLYRLAKNEEIPFIRRKGVGIRLRLQDLDDWLNEGYSKRKSLLDPYPMVDIPLKAHYKLCLKGVSVVANKARRWNYGDYGVFVRRTKGGRERWYGWHYERVCGRRKRSKKVIPGATCRDEAVFVSRERAVNAFKDEHGIKTETKAIGFSTYSKVYLEEHIMLSRRNWKSDKYRLDITAGYFGEAELRMITRSTLAKFRDSRLKAGNSTSTANRYMALLKKMFNLAIEDGYMDRNPLKGLKFFSETNTVRDRVLSRAEEERLLDELSEPKRLVFVAALNTGMRKSELLSLPWENVDLKKRSIKVERTKSGKARFIPINSDLFGELERLKRESGGKGQVFPYKSVRTVFENARKRACIKDLTFHDLRRTFGTRLLERGANIVKIQRLYGHSSVLVTERYLHPQDQASRDAVELLCRGPKERTESKGVLSRICPTEKDETSQEVLNTSLSVH